MTYDKPLPLSGSQFPHLPNHEVTPKTKTLQGPLQGHKIGRGFTTTSSSLSENWAWGEDLEDSWVHLDCISSHGPKGQELPVGSSRRLPPALCLCQPDLTSAKLRQVFISSDS